MSEMSEETHRFVDVLLKCGAMLGAGLAFVVGLCQYQELREREFRTDYWQRQLALYFDATRVAGMIATHGVGKKALQENLKHEFFALYFSPMLAVADEDVAGAMADIARCYDKDDHPCDDPQKLQDRAARLAHAIRRSIAASWNVALPDLKFKHMPQAP